MATITSSASGNFSASGTWIGGVVPGSNDIAVAATGHTVAIDTNVTVQEFQTAGTGIFTLGNDRTVNGTVRGTAGIANGVINVIATTSATVNGLIFNGNPGLTAQNSCLYLSGTGTLYVNGDVYGGGQSTAQRYGIHSIAGPVVVVGNVYGRNATAIFTSGTTATVTVTGSVFGGAGGAGGGGIYTLGTSGHITVTGSVRGGDGGTGSGPIAVRSDSGNITITGDVAGGVGLQAYGVYALGSVASRTVSVVGNVTAGPASAPGIVDTNALGGATLVGGSMTDSANGDCAVMARRFKFIPTAGAIHKHDNYAAFPNESYLTYGQSDYVPSGLPSVSDVRSGVTYGSPQVSGTMSVPNASDVYSGVPVGSTTGTATISAASMASIVQSQLTAASTL